MQCWVFPRLLWRKAQLLLEVFLVGGKKMASTFNTNG